MLEQIHQTLVRACGLTPTSKIVVGVSGGADSVCLLDCLHRIGCAITIGHVDHQLRLTSGQEAQFVKTLAEKYACEYRLASINIKRISEEKRQGIEETGREERYRFLFSLADEVGAEAVAVAHHADDQVETILLSFIRGSGLRGLAGMRHRSISPYHASISLVRPLLGVWREEILHYCGERGLPYCDDESNLDLKYVRNRIRHELIPQLSQYNPNIKTSIARMASLLADDQQLLDTLTATAEKKIGLIVEDQSTSFRLHDFAALDISLQRQVIKRALQTSFFHAQIINSNAIELIRSFFNQEIQSLSMPLEGGIFVLKEEGKGYITSDPASVWKADWPTLEEPLLIRLERAESYPISKNWRLRILKKDIGQVDTDIKLNKDPNVAYLDGDQIADTLTVRKWLPGDQFRPLGMNGKAVKVSDFWINRKIPKRARHTWPLVFSGSELVWIPGFQPSHQVRVTDVTRRVIAIYLESTG